MDAIHIMRPGRHTSSEGQAIDFNPALFQDIATAYNRDLHEAPIVVGHPVSDAPAYGWVDRVEARADGLYAVPRQVNADFAEVVKAGAYKKVSGSFYRPDHPNSPVPGRWYLRHVGFLGAQAPAVKGLKAVSFADGAGFADFEESRLDLREHRIATREREFLRADDAAFVQAVVRKGTLPIGLKDEALAFMESLSRDSVVSFSDGGETVNKPQAEWFRSFLDRLPLPVVTGELMGSFEEEGEGFTAPKGHTVDPEAATIHSAALTHAKKHGVSYADAVRAVATFR